MNWPSMDLSHKVQRIILKILSLAEIHSSRVFFFYYVSPWLILHSKAG